MWVDFRTDKSSTGRTLIAKPKVVHVERVYDAIDFAGIFGWS